ncbi:MAG: hypothetical protein HW374_1144 [Bacteroidetes bacterium]|nr:hypothetical protein [Bacteroidota bacterium]
MSGKNLERILTDSAKQKNPLLPSPHNFQSFPKNEKNRMDRFPKLRNNAAKGPKTANCCDKKR